MKICIATDFHLSYRQYGLEEREHDFYRQYERLIDAIIDEQPDIFIQLGDIFDTPYPKPIAIRHYEDGIDRLINEGIICYGIIGNHTLVQRKGYYPIDNIFDDKVTLLDEDSIRLGDVFICGLKYHPKNHNIKEKIDKLYDDAEGCRLKILLLHQILKQDQSIGYDFDEEELELNRFDYVFLGHFHQRILRYDRTTDSVIHYVGSLNSCNITELRDEMRYGRGYTVFDTDYCFIEMKSIGSCRDYLEFNLTDDDLNDEYIGELIEILTGCDNKPIVQLNISTNDASNIYWFAEKLKSYCLRVKHTIIQNDNMPVDHETLDFSKNSIDEIIYGKFDEKWKGDLCLGLMELLGKGRVDEAKELAMEVYNMQYKS